MDRTITFYYPNGEVKVEPLTNETLGTSIGKKTRYTLADGTVKVGFSQPFRTHDEGFDGKVRGYVYLWNWDNLDEEKHELIGESRDRYNQTFEKVEIEEIVKAETVLFSNSRWGGMLTNRFPVD